MNFLNRYRSVATQVVDLRNQSPIPFLITNGLPNLSTVFYGIEKSCGIDIAFVVQSRIDSGIYKLVAIQLKNDRAIIATETLLTLSPGLQYLENSYRQFVVTGEWRSRPPLSMTCGPGYDKWDTWHQFCVDHDDSIGNNWIRIGLVSRNVDADVYRYLKEEEFLRRLDKKTKKWVWTWFASSEKKSKRIDRLAEAKLSSLLFLSFSSPRWLSPALKERFVNAQEDGHVLTFPMGKKESKYWIPVTVKESQARLLQLGSEIEQKKK